MWATRPDARAAHPEEDQGTRSSSPAPTGWMLSREANLELFADHTADADLHFRSCSDLAPAFVAACAASREPAAA